MPPHDGSTGALLDQHWSQPVTMSSRVSARDLHSWFPGLQHLAEDADLVAAESGLVSIASSDGSSFDSADTQPSTMRRRLTSAGIADAEGTLHLSTAVQAVSLKFHHEPTACSRCTQMYL
jgi:hypothetical protein